MDSLDNLESTVSAPRRRKDNANLFIKFTVKKIGQIKIFN